MDRLSDLKQRIDEDYVILRTYERQRDDASNRPDEQKRCEHMVEDYRRLLRPLLATYIKIAERSSEPVPKDVAELAADLIDYGQPPQPGTGATGISAPFTTLPGARIVRVEVSQMFRLVDLLISPEQVKAKQFYQCISGQSAALYRMLNSKKGFPLGELGVLSPVTGYGAADPFWRPALPNRKFSAGRPLGFFPFELSLNERLQQFKANPDSVHKPGEGPSSLVNTQIGGRLRLYPPGTGVIQLNLTLEFRESISVETVADITHYFDDLLFVDPSGGSEPCSKLFLKVLADVVQQLFTEGAVQVDDLPWLPPEATISIQDDTGFAAAEHVDELAYLMQLTPGNREPSQLLRNRIARALSTLQWQKEHVLFVAGQGVALFFVSAAFADGQREQRKRLLRWLGETRELVAAALYAQQAFAGELEPLYDGRLLDDSFLPDGGPSFDELGRLLRAMRSVLQAITSIRQHLEAHGCGALVDFAKQLWAFNGPPRQPGIAELMSYIGGWLDGLPQLSQDERLRALRQVVEEIARIRPPYTAQLDGSVMVLDTSAQEALEEQLLSEVSKAEAALGGGAPGAAALIRSLNSIQSLQRRLGIGE